MINDFIYYCENNIGNVFCHYDRQETFNWYERNNGVKIYTKTKDLFPKIEIIVDRPNVDVRNIRKDDIVSKTTVARRKANAKYDKDHTKQIMLKLNLETDKEIIELLSNLENKQGYIKDLIKSDLEKRKSN